MMRLGSLLVTFVLVACSGPASTATPAIPAAPAATPAPALERVTRVLDGDTVEIGAERIRLKGINAPEKGECGADRATARLSELVEGGVRVDRRGTGDRGRSLAYLWSADGIAIHTDLARAGLVLAYPYGQHDDQTEAIAAAEQEARVAASGLFDPAACGPRLQGASAVAIAAVVHNPPGDDLEVGAGEHVVISGPPGTDLSGWTLKDTSASNRFVFPKGTTIPPVGTLRVHTPCGEPRAEALFMCRKGAGVWNNGGDVAFLLDPSGNLVSERPTP